jgi:hypothetical protein
MPGRNPVATGVSARPELDCQQIGQFVAERQGEDAVFNVISNAPMFIVGLNRSQLVKLSIQIGVAPKLFPKLLDQLSVSIRIAQGPGNILPPNVV